MISRAYTDVRALLCNLFEIFFNLNCDVSCDNFLYSGIQLSIYTYRDLHVPGNKLCFRLYCGDTILWQPHLNAPLDSNKITWLAFFFLDLTFRGA